MAKMERKCFTVLENNPEVMNTLAKRMGLSEELVFYDVYSLNEPDLLAHIPRPVYALLAIVPMTEAWATDREAEDTRDKSVYDGSGENEPVLWFRQTIGNACGSIGLVHCALNINGPGVPPTSSARPLPFVAPGSDLDQLFREALPLKPGVRAQMLYDSEVFEAAHRSVAGMGDSPVPPVEESNGQHFIAFARGRDGHLWELEGSRKGPIDRGALADDEDVLSPRVVELGLGRIMKLEGGDNIRFSCIALARRGQH